jgi:hypothetical protein
VAEAEQLVGVVVEDLVEIGLGTSTITAAPSFQLLRRSITQAPAAGNCFCRFAHAVRNPQ